MTTDPKFQNNRQVAIEIVTTLNPAEEYAVVRDRLETVKDEGITHLEYANRIGKGNLKSYSRCLLLNPENSDLLHLDTERS